METMPVPTADGELLPAKMNVPVRRTVLNITPEREPLSEFDQVCEPATFITVGVLVELDTEENLID